MNRWQDAQFQMVDVKGPAEGEGLVFSIYQSWMNTGLEDFMLEAPLQLLLLTATDHYTGRDREKLCSYLIFFPPQSNKDS